MASIGRQSLRLGESPSFWGRPIGRHTLSRILPDRRNCQIPGNRSARQLRHGGYLGPELKFAGYDHLVIEGKAEKPVYLSIRDDHVEIRDASSLWGQDTYETPAVVRQELQDPAAKVVSIGPAGERLVVYASINSGTGNTAARTGLGAVMGSKNLKAIAVRGTRGIKIARPGEFLEGCRKLLDSIRQAKFYGDLHEAGLTRIHDREMRGLYELLGNATEECKTICEADF